MDGSRSDWRNLLLVFAVVMYWAGNALWSFLKQRSSEEDFSYLIKEQEGAISDLSTGTDAGGIKLDNQKKKQKSHMLPGNGIHAEEFDISLDTTRKEKVPELDKKDSYSFELFQDSSGILSALISHEILSPPRSKRSLADRSS